ncbi:hypothetical protein TorRG33x02_343350, partial [Trema orientale]
QKIKYQQGIYIKGFKTLPKICGRQCIHYLTYITFLVADISTEKIEPKKKKTNTRIQLEKKKKHTHTHNRIHRP